MLGEAVEKKLMVTIADAALMHCPYRYAEIEELLRRTCIEMNLVVPKTGTPYTQLTDVSTMVAGFVRRCAERGVHFIEKNGRPLPSSGASTVPASCRRRPCSRRPAAS